MGQILNPFLISWFSRADYPAVRLLDLGVRMPASFDEWLARALAICLQIEAQHGTAERVFVHSKAFSEWCRDNLRPTNERSLNEFIHWSQSSSPLASGLLPRPHETPESEELQ